MFKYPVIFFVCMVGAVGCSSPYVQPDAQDAAVLTFINKTPMTVRLTGYEKAEDCSGKRLDFNNTGKLFSDSGLITTLKPDEPFSFAFHYSDYTTRKYCDMAATFTPKPKGNYVARFSTNDDKCYLVVFTSTKNGVSIEPSYKPRVHKTAVWEGGSWCD